MTQGDDWAANGDAISTAIRVDLAALTEFGDEVGRYAANVVGTASERLILVFADGVQFGSQTSSADVQAARDAYAQCLAAMSEQLNALVEAASTLASAAATIASEYAQTDAAVTSAVQRASAYRMAHELKSNRGWLE